MAPERRLSPESAKLSLLLDSQISQQQSGTAAVPLNADLHGYFQFIDRGKQGTSLKDLIGPSGVA